jgi:hypothetical protein
MSPERDVPVAKGRSLYHFMSLVMYLHYLYLSLPPLFRLHSAFIRTAWEIFADISSLLILVNTFELVR